jgi:Zn-dependent M32 family carboxypeptidase
MAKIFYKQIIKGTITIKDVPEMWREAVSVMLEG